VQGEERVPESPVEAMVHPDIRVFTAVTKGRIPGLSQYRTVIDTVRLLRQRDKLDDQAIGRFQPKQRQVSLIRSREKKISFNSSSKNSS
jgi:hypothetical protein